VTVPAFLMSREKALLFLAQHPGTAGICERCGCTHWNPCRFPGEIHATVNRHPPRPVYVACGWAGSTGTLCNNPVCIAQAEEAATRVASPSA
jgi:hypothetical protein